jgi:hypothetical protein
MGSTGNLPPGMFSVNFVGEELSQIDVVLVGRVIDNVLDKLPGLLHGASGTT